MNSILSASNDLTKLLCVGEMKGRSLVIDFDWGQSLCFGEMKGQSLCFVRGKERSLFVDIWLGGIALFSGRK